VAKSKQSNKGKQQSKSSSKAKGAPKKPVNKRRGALLSVLIILIGVHGITAAILCYSYLKQPYIIQRPWMIGILALISLADIVAAVGLWLWKQWGMYVYIIATAALAAISIVLTANVWVSLYQFIPVAILGYVISLQNKQKLFE
jgi:hypothetical protein